VRRTLANVWHLLDARNPYMRDSRDRLTPCDAPLTQTQLRIDSMRSEEAILRKVVVRGTIEPSFYVKGNPIYRKRAQLGDTVV
jgi:hypothetical protein